MQVPSAVHVVLELPTTGSGKVLKTALRSQYAPRSASVATSGPKAPGLLASAGLADVARQVAALCGGAASSALGPEGGAGGGAATCVALVTTADSALSDVSYNTCSIKSSCFSGNCMAARNARAKSDFLCSSITSRILGFVNLGY